MCNGTAVYSPAPPQESSEPPFDRMTVEERKAYLATCEGWEVKALLLEASEANDELRSELRNLRRAA